MNGRRSGLVGIGLLIAGCGSDSKDARPTDAGGADVAVGACTPNGPASGPHAVYLAFDGVALLPVPDGQDDATKNASSFVTIATAYPPFLAGAPDRSARIDSIVNGVRQVLDPFDVEVTKEKPASDHIMVVFAGQAGGGLIGLVRHDCGNQVKNDVVIFFEDVADPSREPFAAANETVFVVMRSLGLAKSSGPGHPCSCDPSGACDNLELCTPAVNAETSFGTCADTPAVQNEVAILSATFGCKPVP